MKVRVLISDPPRGKVWKDHEVDRVALEDVYAFGSWMLAEYTNDDMGLPIRDVWIFA